MEAPWGVEATIENNSTVFLLEDNSTTTAHIDVFWATDPVMAQRLDAMRLRLNKRNIDVCTIQVASENQLADEPSRLCGEISEAKLVWSELRVAEERKWRSTEIVHKRPR